jgi:hypothetical protein
MQNDTGGFNLIMADMNEIRIIDFVGIFTEFEPRVFFFSQ